MTEPGGDGWDVDPALDAVGGEKVAEVMDAEMRETESPAGSGEAFFGRLDLEDGIGGARSVEAAAIEEAGDAVGDGDAAELMTFGAGAALGVGFPPDEDFGGLDVSPGDFAGFSDAATHEGEEFDEVAAFGRGGFFDGLDFEEDGFELVIGGDDELGGRELELATTGHDPGGDFETGIGGVAEGGLDDSEDVVSGAFGVAGGDAGPPGEHFGTGGTDDELGGGEVLERVADDVAVVVFGALLEVGSLVLVI